MQTRLDRILEIAKPRFVALLIGFVAHFARVLALAPILGSLVIALIIVTAMTWLNDWSDWLLEPVFGVILPESLQGDFSGGLMEFGLPIAWKHMGTLVWACIILSIVEQFKGREWRKRIFSFKYWALGFGAYFLAVTLFMIFFHRIEGTFLEGMLLFTVLIGFLYGATLSGLVAFKIIGFVEGKLVEKYSEDGDAGAEEVSENSSV